MNRKYTSGLTLIELVISLAILGIIMAGLHQAIGAALATHRFTRNEQALLAEAHFAMSRMVMFLRETEYVGKPDLGKTEEKLEIAEHVLDTYDNLTHSYTVDGDGILDADNNANGLVNEDGDKSEVKEDGDPLELVVFELDTELDDNWKLTEERPDYATADFRDMTSPVVLCEHVKTFACTHTTNTVVGLYLVLEDGPHRVELQTRVKPRRLHGWTKEQKVEEGD